MRVPAVHAAPSRAKFRPQRLPTRQSRRIDGLRSTERTQRATRPAPAAGRTSTARSHGASVPPIQTTTPMRRLVPLGVRPSEPIGCRHKTRQSAPPGPCRGRRPTTAALRPAMRLGRGLARPMSIDLLIRPDPGPDPNGARRRPRARHRNRPRPPVRRVLLPGRQVAVSPGRAAAGRRDAQFPAAGEDNLQLAAGCPRLVTARREQRATDRH